jgi:hypothetical protein
LWRMVAVHSCWLQVQVTRRWLPIVQVGLRIKRT